MSDILTFACPNQVCGGTKLGKATSAVRSAEISVITETGHLVELGNAEITYGDILRYYCIECGKAVEDINGNPITNADDLVKWLIDPESVG
jgi:hypothetical protein